MKHVMVAVGSVYIDRGETLEKALDQVRRMSAEKPVAYMFDVLCQPDQIQQGTACLAAVAELISELNPDIPPERKTFGLTTDDRFRPGVMAATVNAATKGRKVKIKDIDPDGRRQR